MDFQKDDSNGVCDHMQAGAEGSVMLGVIRTVQRKETGECLTNHSAMHRFGFDDSLTVWECLQTEWSVCSGQSSSAISSCVALARGWLGRCMWGRQLPRSVIMLVWTPDRL